jgi:hypothetical protein
MTWYAGVSRKVIAIQTPLFGMFFPYQRIEEREV